MKMHYQNRPSGHLHGLVEDDLERIEKTLKETETEDLNDYLMANWGVTFVATGARVIQVEGMPLRITLKSILTVVPIEGGK